LSRLTALAGSTIFGSESFPSRKKEGQNLNPIASISKDETSIAKNCTPII